MCVDEVLRGVGDKCLKLISVNSFVCRIVLSSCVPDNLKSKPGRPRESSEVHCCVRNGARSLG